MKWFLDKEKKPSHFLFINSDILQVRCLFHKELKAQIRNRHPVGYPTVLSPYLETKPFIERVWTCRKAPQELYSLSVNLTGLRRWASSITEVEKPYRKNPMILV